MCLGYTQANSHQEQNFSNLSKTFQIFLPLSLNVKIRLYSTYAVQDPELLAVSPPDQGRYYRPLARPLGDKNRLTVSRKIDKMVRIKNKR